MRFPRRPPLQKLAEGCPVACRRGMLHPAVSSLPRGKGVQMSRREIGSSLDMISADEAAITRGLVRRSGSMPCLLASAIAASMRSLSPGSPHRPAAAASSSTERARVSSITATAEESP